MYLSLRIATETGSRASHDTRNTCNLRPDLRSVVFASSIRCPTFAHYLLPLIHHDLRVSGQQYFTNGGSDDNNTTTYWGVTVLKRNRVSQRNALAAIAALTDRMR